MSGATETRRAVDCHGNVYEVKCERIDRVYNGAPSTFWTVRCPTVKFPHSPWDAYNTDTCKSFDDAFARWAGGMLHILAPGEATTAEQLAATLVQVVDIAETVEAEADAGRAETVARKGHALHDLARYEGRAHAANAIACAVRRMLDGQNVAALTTPLRERLAAVEAERDALRAALRTHGPRCRLCGRVGTYCDASELAYCDECVRGYGGGVVKIDHADALRSLNTETPR